MKDADLSDCGKMEMATDITRYTRNSFGEKFAELLLSLSFNSSISRLTVNVLEAKYLKYGRWREVNL